MMKILHSADWHLDSPLQGRTENRTEQLKEALLRLPHQVMAAARAQGCDLVLLAGDLFDGPSTPESRKAVKDALGEAAIPVFIAPGNHDALSAASPWLTEIWPENVHIFQTPVMESVALPELDCRVYGAAFTAGRSGSLLEGFRAEQTERYALGVLHGDPTQSSSPYNPVTAEQLRSCGLQYLALGHIHKEGRLLAGSTLCGWPGCPMGRGFDELGPKGVYVVTLEEGCTVEFLPLDTPRFYDWECRAEGDAAQALARLLPALGSDDDYRITLTGESEPLDLETLAAGFAQFPNLQLRDRTVPPVDLWADAGEDTLQGIYFRMLRQALEGQDEAQCRRILLAARISRQLLENQEVKLP